jgi:small subunit ribosomal protein S17
MADEKQDETEIPAEPESLEEEAPAPAEAQEESAESVESTTASEEPRAELEAKATESGPVAEEVPAEAETAEPVAEEAVADAAPAEGETPPVAAPAAQQAPAAEAPVRSEPKPKGKRLPRRLRPQKTRPRRPAATGTRKPVVREAKPEHARGHRQERRGVVVSAAMDKTIVVKVDVTKSHPKYKKVVRRSVRFHAHDEQNVANVGDVVRIVETRPLSATKRWRLAEVLEAAK